MRFSVATVLAFAATAFAQAADFDPIYTPKSEETIPAGSTYTVTWQAPAKYAAGTIKIELIGGATQPTQVKLADIASGIKNSANEYTWSVDASLGGEAVYGLVFRLESDPTNIFQYSNPFHIKASDKNTGTSSGSSGATTLTKSQGVKTVTLSTTSTPVTTTSAPVTTSHTQVKQNTTTAANTTTLVKVSSSQSAPAIVTSTQVVGSTATTATTVPTPTAGANAVRVGSLTILGVVAAVLFL